jgi:ribonucleoside-diphosphate reductase alpha chain/ribonucleoside-triphosphate reductase
MPKVRTNVEVIHKDYQPIAKGLREECTSLEFNGDMVKITVGDSKEGWTQALDFYLKVLYNKEYKSVSTIIIDYDNVRPKGERLKRFGGTSSGHESLKNMFTKINKVIQKRGQLVGGYHVEIAPIDAMDIANIIGENVVVGGVRRTAEIGLVDTDDQECITAKNKMYFQDEAGNWKEDKEILHRRMSNNSIMYYEKPTREKLHWQMETMRWSGEPAFINAESALKRRPMFNGLNPCAEILLDSKGLCNLTTVNALAFVRDGVLDLEGLLEAQKLSARAGYRMTCVTLELHKWDIIQKRDRLIGTSISGWQDMKDAIGMSDSAEIVLLQTMRKVVHDEAEKMAKQLGGNIPLLMTTVKPEGTLSQVAGGISAGVHYSHSPYYIRRIRINANDPLVKVCEELGYPVFPETGQEWDTCNTKVVEFPMSTPTKKTKYDVTAIDQLENYKRFQKHYTDHNTSITVSVRSHEWEAVEQWIWDNWDDLVAVSFLPLDDSYYPLLPYEAIEKEEYDRRKAEMKPFVPSLLRKFEKQEVELDIGGNDPDCTTGACGVR